MKKHLLFSVFFLFFILTSIAQPAIEGACIKNDCVSLLDGSGTLGQIYANSACGLNYVQASRKVTTRYATPAGSGLPVTLSISGIPTCYQIEQAYLWWTFAGTTNTATATVTNPVGSTQTLNATLAGSGPAKCWSEGGTRLFRADVTSLISGNGNYNINLNTTVYGTDGITLFIIYRDLSATYTGNIYINDGLRVQSGGSQTQALTYPAACQAGTNGRAFSIVSDMQDNVGATHTATHNGVNTNFPSNFYNFDQSNVTINSGQASSNFGYNKGGDCWAWSMMGLYFQTNCVTCTPAGGTPSTAAISQTSICSGQNVNLSLSPVPSTMQWQSAPTSTGPWTTIAGATTSPYNSGALTNNTCYRAYYPSACGTDTSNIVCVTVDGLSTAPTGATASPNTICAATNVTLNVVGGSLATGATWQWYSGSCGGTSVGSGASITVNPTNTTTYYVRAEGLCNTTSCASVTVNVFVSPSAQFASTSPCAPNGTVFTDNSVANSTGGISSWSWNFGDGNTSTQQNPTHTYTSNGNYNVTLLITNADGCTDTITQTVTVYPKPVADYTFTNQCDGNPITFNSTSTINAPGTINSYNWNFGDNTSGSGSSVSHTYNSPGNYNVTLIVNSNNSCADTITQQITVYNNPTASFTHLDVCLGNAVNFTNTSTVNAPDVINSYLWAFGDGSPTSTSTNPSHLYLNPGTYSVTLIATTANSCSDVTSINVNVYDAPTSSFTFNDECENILVSFTNTSSNPSSGTIASFAWNFGDGSPINTTNSNPTHTYTTAGTYTVTLISYSSNLGCSDTAQQTITIFPSPVSSFTFTNQCFGTAIPFTDQSTGTITNYNWSFGDNTNSGLQNPTHNYSAAGNYVVTLTVTSNNGCTNTSLQNITVYPSPTADFSATEVCNGMPTSFESTSTVTMPDIITNYVWDYGDGSGFGSGANTSHNYLAPGMYQVTLAVSTNNNCIDTVTIPIFVNPNPVVDFIADSLNGCTPLCVTFSNFSTITAGTIATYQWSFGDGEQSFSTNPSHCYINESLSQQNYNVTLTAMSDKGCTSLLNKANYITAYPLPIADFSTDPNPTDIFRSNIQFTDLSISASYWLWNFGDNSTTGDTLLQNPQHLYADTGVYIVTLYIENSYGCSDSTLKLVDIRPDFAIFIPNAFTPNGDAYNTHFGAKGYGIAEFTMYIFNRWGEKIFESTNINTGWDGSYTGMPAQEDTYIYRIEVKDLNNKKHSYYGAFTLIR
jgi:gliding motility-associated-like protein